MTKKIYDYFVVAFAGLCMYNINKTLTLTGWQSYVYPALGASAIYFLLNLPLAFHWVRKIIDKRAQYEGIWIEKVDKNNSIYYSLYEMRYRFIDSSYKFAGFATKANGDLHATWNSTATQFDLEHDRINYIFSANVADTTDHNLDGYTHISFTTS